VKGFKVAILLVLLAVLALPAYWFFTSDRFKEMASEVESKFEGEDPDMEAEEGMDKALYMQLRSEQIAFYRGLDTAKVDSRINAIHAMERDEEALARRRMETGERPDASWQPLGPSPIPNGQTSGRTDPVVGRIAAIAVHPTDPNIVYAGAAGGGL